MAAEVIRPAVLADVPAIVAMLADDPLGRDREDLASMAPYEAAFARIADDPNQLLVVADRGGEVNGTLQLTLVHGLSRRGATRAIIEAVRVAASARGSGLGSRLVEWAVATAWEHDAVVVQLTSDRTRTDAHRFYERLGFVPSHVGFKLVR